MLLKRNVKQGGCWVAWKASIVFSIDTNIPIAFLAALPHILQCVPGKWAEPTSWPPKEDCWPNQSILCFPEGDIQVRWAVPSPGSSADLTNLSKCQLCRWTRFLGDLRWVARFGLKWAKSVRAKSKHLQAASSKSMCTTVSWSRWGLICDLLGSFGSFWVRDNAWGRNLSILNF